MRRLGLVIAIVVGASASADAKPSNPAFLGIGMRDLQGQLGTGAVLGPCIVETVTRGSGASSAGVQPGDHLVSIGGVLVPTCDAVQRVVQARQTGDTVAVVVQRVGRMVTLKAPLWSRDEILRRRHVGQPIGATDVYVLDEQRTYDLGGLRGKTAVVGWFDRRCDGCKSVFTRVARWVEGQGDKPGAPPIAYAVTAGDRDNPSQFTLGALDVPHAIADPSLYEDFTIPDAERIHFMVVDCRGIVQYVAPVAPGGDDTEAVLDELFAAAEQAARRALSR